MRPGRPGMAAFAASAWQGPRFPPTIGGGQQAGNDLTESAIVAETAARIFADLADPQEINRAKDGAWKEPLWRALADAGLTLAWVPEEQGRAGAGRARGV